MSNLLHWANPKPNSIYIKLGRTTLANQTEQYIQSLTQYIDTIHDTAMNLGIPFFFVPRWDILRKAKTQTLRRRNPVSMNQSNGHIKIFWGGSPRHLEIIFLGPNT